MTYRYKHALTALVGVMSLALPALSAVGAPIEETQPASIDGEVQDLKDAVLDLNRELFMLEEELLYPANTQIAVFLSMDIGEFFALDSVQLKVDGKEVTSYLYTERRGAAPVHR